MSDRELLEFAAKASGVFLTKDTLSDFFPGWDWEDEDEPRHEECGGISGTVVIYGYDGELSGTTRETWNPLEDDGEALRLAVSLQISLIQHPSGMDVTVVFPPKFNCEPIIEQLTLCPFIGMRRAIVRAAAEIGRRL